MKANETLPLGEKRTKKFIPFFDSLDRLRNWAKREIGYVRMSGNDFLRIIFTAAMTDDSVRLVMNLTTDYYKEFVRGEVKELLDRARSSAPVAEKIEKENEGLQRRCLTASKRS